MENSAGGWLIECNGGPSPPFFEADLHKYERVPAPESWMSEQAMTPAQEARLQMIQPLLDCDDCIPDKSLRYKMAADAAQQYQTTGRSFWCGIMIPGNCWSGSRGVSDECRTVRSGSWCEEVL